MPGITAQVPLTRQSNSLQVRVRGQPQVPCKKSCATMVLITHIQLSHPALSAQLATTVMNKEWTRRKTALWDTTALLASFHTRPIPVLYQRTEHRPISMKQVSVNPAPQEDTVPVPAKSLRLVTVQLDTTVMQIQQHPPLLAPQMLTDNALGIIGALQVLVWVFLPSLVSGTHQSEDQRNQQLKSLKVTGLTRSPTLRPTSQHQPWQKVTVQLDTIVLLVAHGPLMQLISAM